MRFHTNAMLMYSKCLLNVMKRDTHTYEHVFCVIYGNERCTHACDTYDERRRTKEVERRKKNGKRTHDVVTRATNATRVRPEDDSTYVTTMTTMMKKKITCRNEDCGEVYGRDPGSAIHNTMEGCQALLERPRRNARRVCRRVQ